MNRPDPPPHDHEGRLLGAIARGDRAAFSELYQRIGPKLFALVLRICGDKALAEDAFQEVFVAVWREAERFDPARGRAGAWLAVLARNRAIDALRRAGKPGGACSEREIALIEALPDETQHPEGSLAIMMLLDCLSRLDLRTRELVLLAYYEGHTRESLAERFDSPVNTVKTWLRRGLADLRTCMDG
ncbi:MAG: sigma-70 family RNA polymerase sigma factor [Pseudomonadota bacterium]